MTRMPDPLRTALVTVGDELLLGRTVDTNAAWLGAELAELGIPVARRHTVADDAEEIQRAVADALGAAELVVVTGGLGPTPDDLTRDAVAALLGRALPEGARKLTNPEGTAPGLALEADGRLVVLLPGVPRELKAIFAGDLRAVLRERFHGRLRPVHTRTIHTTGIPESLLGQRIEGALVGGTGPVGIAFLPDELGVDLRFTAMDMDEAEAHGRFDAIERRLAEVLDPWRYTSAGGDIVEAVSDALRATGKTLAVAESCTGGLVAKRMTDLAGSSAIFLGGVVAYADPVKIGMLGVDPAALAEHGAVSEPVARRMALGVAEALGADAGIGITGVAGPDGGSDEKPIGTVWYAAALDGRAVVRRDRFPGDRRAVRERAAQAALFLLLRLLEGRNDG